MKVKRELNKPPVVKNVPHDKLETGHIYRSANVSINHATVFLATETGVVDIHTGHYHDADLCATYVELNGYMTLTGDVHE